MTNANLEELALKYNSDKANRAHGYTGFYTSMFESHWRKAAQVVVEIGTWKGDSLRMWTDYFENAAIFGIDLPKPYRPDDTMQGLPQFDNPRVKLLHGDQANRLDLRMIVEAIGQPIDILIEDGGHLMAQQQTSFGFLFPYLGPGGIFVVEDLYTSWHKSLLGTDWNPTKTQWTTLRLVRAMAASEPWESDFMTADEMAYLQEHVVKVIVERGRHSEIAFLEKGK